MPSFVAPSVVPVIAGFLLALLASVASIAFPSGISMAGIEGRWTAEGSDLVLDFTRCGERFCGQVVGAGGQCGRTVLTLEADAGGPPDGVALNGKLESNGEARLPKGVFQASASIKRATEGGALQMKLWGYDPSIFRRTLPFQALLVRTGEPSCQPSPTS